MTLTRDAFISSPIPIERHLRRLFPRLDASIVFDIGSCEGEDAIRYAALFPAGTVYAVEPLPDNLELLRANLLRYPWANVRVLGVALSDRAGREPFYVSSGQPDGVTPGAWDYGNKSSSLLPPDRHLQVHPWVHFDHQILVETQTLEHVCHREGIQGIDLVHLDVQGAELKVLAGAGPYLERISAIWMEVEAVPLYEGQPLEDDVERFMVWHGFRRMLDTVDSISGDQLYFNPRILRPRPDPWNSAAITFLRRLPARAARKIVRQRQHLPLHPPRLRADPEVSSRSMNSRRTPPGGSSARCSANPFTCRRAAAVLSRSGASGC